MMNLLRVSSIACLCFLFALSSQHATGEQKQGKLEVNIHDALDLSKSYAEQSPDCHIRGAILQIDKDGQMFWEISFYSNRYLDKTKVTRGGFFIIKVFMDRTVEVYRGK